MNRLTYIILILIGYGLLIQDANSQDDSNNTDTIVTDSTSNSNVTSTAQTTTTLKSPPPSAITPTINTSNSDLCTFGVAGAIQTQILGLSSGTQVRDMNCERLKNAKVMYDMGMKVAAVSVMCQDKRVFDAMMNAGTPCPFDGMIGVDAKAAWEGNMDKQPDAEAEDKELTDGTKTLIGGAGVASLLLLLLL
tara:strand:- start:922 stop:1497 length:576 start_codon:yes stop_codon:yes gene_type:complete